MFLVKDDYITLIRQDKLDQITEADDTILSKALPAAQEEAAGFIRHRYDEDQVFKAVTEKADNNVSGVTTGDRFYQTTTKLFYVATADGGTVLTDTDFFDQVDDRNPKLVEVVVDILLYNIYSRINPKSVPTHRRIRYDGDDPKQQGGAYGWLKMVQKGTIEPNLPAIVDENGDSPQNTESVAFGQTSTEEYGF
jgi:hypothetical protein